ncbi:OsmC family protein [Lactobacillus sp. CC-MHH1034]|uniref:OsmC family protein n=1 Tax=Agrilactobacillus fermenti TaxID=2586909 RepID=UPI001E53EAE5|nr:OsmC family protein [Agrilactobacillus fermenti]MCD2257271.1 OsmC family protein [Agrilactobacillus fermenti]
MEKHLTVHLNENGMVMENKGQILHIGHDQGEISPVKLLQTAAAACSLGTFRIILNNSKIAFDDLSIDSTMIQDDHLPNQVRQMDLTITVTNAQADEEKLQRILAMTTRTCTVVQSIKDSIEIHEHLRILP